MFVMEPVSKKGETGAVQNFDFGWLKCHLRRHSVRFLRLLCDFVNYSNATAHQSRFFVQRDCV